MFRSRKLKKMSISEYLKRLTLFLWILAWPRGGLFVTVTQLLVCTAVDTAPSPPPQRMVVQGDGGLGAVGGGRMYNMPTHTVHYTHHCNTDHGCRRARVSVHTATSAPPSGQSRRDAARRLQIYLSTSWSSTTPSPLEWSVHQHLIVTPKIRYLACSNSFPHFHDWLVPLLFKHEKLLLGPQLEPQAPCFLCMCANRYIIKANCQILVRTYIFL